MQTEILDYYRQPAEITNLEKYTEFIHWLSDDPFVIYQVVQGLIVHDAWLKNYGEPYLKAHEYPQKIAFMQDLLDKALELDGSNLSIPRHPRDRVIACCREFATLMVALLRAKGVPARSRCGFASYFGWNGQYEDHWICEYWDKDRWVRADPQLDPFQQSCLRDWAGQSGLTAEKARRIRNFNPRDLKPEDFLPAGQAWLLCRQAKANPMNFGISSPIRPEWGIDTLFGLWFVRGQLMRDFAALNKVETVPFLIRISKKLSWQPWRLVGAKDEELSEQDLALLDTIAGYSAHADEHFEEIRQAYRSQGDLAVPPEIVSRY